MSSQTYFYNTRIQWIRDRTGKLQAGSLPDLLVSPPPEFKGLPGLWTPEHLFVAAAESCLMATFLGIAENSRLGVTAYRSEARGRLEQVEGGGLRFAEITISPVVDLDQPEALALAQRVMAKAERTCLIANSMVTALRVEPQFSIAQAAA